MNAAGTKRRFGRNVAANMGQLMFASLMNLWYTPYLVHTLGVEQYGFIPLSTQVIGYLAIFTSGISTAVGRFLAIDLARHDREAALRTLNTAVFGLAGVVCAALPLIAAGIVFLPRLLTIPAAIIADTRLLFAGVAAAFCVSAVESGLKTIPFSLERHEIGALLEATRIGARMLLVVAAFTLFSPRIGFVGLCVPAAAVISFAASLTAARRLVPSFRLSPFLFSMRDLARMRGMTFWSIATLMGGLIFWCSDLLIVNRLFGPAAAGEYGSVLVLSLMLRTAADTVVRALSPALYKRYALSDHHGLARMAVRVLNILGLSLAFPVGCICGLARPILHVWLGDRFIHLRPLLTALVSHLAVNLAVSPLFAVAQSHARVRLPAIVTLASSLVHLAAAIIVSRHWGVGPLGVALSGAAVLMMKNVIFTPLYTAKIMNVRPVVFYRPLLRNVIAAALTSLVAWLLGSFMHTPTFAGVLAIIGFMAACYAAFMWWTFFSARDRAHILHMASCFIKG